MNFSDLVAQRFSVRKFTQDKIEPEKLNQILQTARIAPTAANIQPQRILVVQSEDGLKRLKEATPCIFNATTALVVCSDKNVAWKNPIDGTSSAQIDSSIIMTHLMYQALELGISSCWVCYFNRELVKKSFDIPTEYEVDSILPIGYAAPDAEPAERHFSRLPIEQTVFFEKFS
jgi:nitroreductase